MENEKKFCEDCGRELVNTPYSLCLECWCKRRNKTAKKCTICGKPLMWEEEKKGWRHCSKCHFKEMAKTLV